MWLYHRNAVLEPALVHFTPLLNVMSLELLISDQLENKTICKHLVYTGGLFFTSGPEMRKIPHHLVGHGTFCPLSCPFVPRQFTNGITEMGHDSLEVQV